MKPVIALVGRPNVGKSTLFNRLTRTRDALVADMPGLTRDRRYGDGRVGDFEYLVVDTGGLLDTDNIFGDMISRQTWLAIEEADMVMFLVDGRSGPTAVDTELAQQLRRLKKPLMLVVNKIDGIGEEQAAAEFYAYGLGEPQTIAAAHNRGVSLMMENAAAKLGITPCPDYEEPDPYARPKRIRIAVIGRPNAGKSTLVNRLLGEERVLASEVAGTTRDSVEIEFERGKREYTLIDTAGVRKRGKVRETVEKFSVIKTLQAIDASNVVVMMIDAREGIAEQDLHLLGYAIDSGRAMVLAVNKWDGLEEYDKENVKRELNRRLEFLRFAKPRFISALHGTGVGELLRAVNKAFDAACIDMATPQLTRLLERAVQQHQGPMVGGRRIKLRYAHQGGSNPPIIIVHGNQTKQVPASYQRYLINFFHNQLDLEGTPLRLEFRASENPFEDRRSNLTPLQKYKKEKNVDRHISKVKKGTKKK